MKPASDFPEANITLAPPEGMERCAPIRAHAFPAIEVEGHPEDSYPGGYVTCWEPDEQERAAIAAGGKVYVFVYCSIDAPPPIGVTGLHPFEEEGDAK